ncbi:MAG: hypothetical protein FWE15_20070 [Actinomycetia bacterium]|nr:hypothetical protein [Actinomycetes bacterium]
MTAGDDDGFRDDDLTGGIIALLKADAGLRHEVLNALTGLRVEYGGGTDEEVFRGAAGLFTCRVLSRHLYLADGVHTARPRTVADRLARAALDAADWRRVADEMLAEADRDAARP